MSFIMAFLQIYQELLSLATFLRVHSNSEKVPYLSWQNTYPNLKTTCHIKLKIILRTKLVENFELWELFAKYLIYVAASLTCALIYSLTKFVLEDDFKDSCVLKIVQNIKTNTWRSLLLRKLQYEESPLLWTKRPAKNNFWGIYDKFNVSNSKYLHCQILFQWGVVRFHDQIFNINSYSFFSSYKTVVGSNIRHQLK